VTADLLARARAGDGDAFGQLTEPHRRELQVHCYRILGSVQDAEDVLQDTLLAAWRGLAGFEERSTLRAWLYRVATNRCLNTLRAARRRPAMDWSVPDVEPPEPSRLGEVVWLEPYPDALLEGLADKPPGPEARYELTEAISLAFVTALQLLPPRQRAVLILRDVLGYHAAEVAEMLDTTVESVTSALKRARASLRRYRTNREPAPSAGSLAEQELVSQLVRAYQTGDVEALTTLLTDDVVVSMPPVPLEYHGRELAARFNATVTFRHGRTYDLVPTRANGQLAFGAYLRDPAGGVRHATGLRVLTLAGNRICGLTRFDNSVLPRFGLPQSLPGLERTPG
jgi:RNA polymerase sigma-70 factor (TIGR02960 family)